MTSDQFEALLNRRLERTRAVLGQKAGEYAAAGDRLHNFKRAGELRGHSAAETLAGMLVKHWVSIEDIVTTYERDGVLPPPWLTDEKITDAVNYLILLEGVIEEARGSGNESGAGPV